MRSHPAVGMSHFSAAMPACPCLKEGSIAAYPVQPATQVEPMVDRSSSLERDVTTLAGRRGGEEHAQ